MTTSESTKWLRQRVLRLLMLAFIAIAGFLLLVTLLLIVAQRSLIYFPQSYASNAHQMAAEGNAREIAFTTPAGRQVMWYVPAPASPEGAPPRLAVFFCGNAMLGLDWLDTVEAIQRVDPDYAALLVDHPGYGFNEGRPTRGTILATVNAVMPALAAELQVEQAALETDLAVVGYSLGAAVAMEFAVRHPVERVGLIAPFTSLLAMAKRTVGWPLMYLLRDRFDNIERMGELARRPGGPPAVAILHGTEDQIVPFAMGESLAAQFRDFTTFSAITPADHNWILDVGRMDILRAIDAVPSDAGGNSTVE